MADASGITVAVESVVLFDVLKDVLQAIHDQHGIIVESVRVSWVDISVLGCPSQCAVTQVEINSRKAF